MRVPTHATASARDGRCPARDLHPSDEAFFRLYDQIEAEQFLFQFPQHEISFQNEERSV